MGLTQNADGLRKRTTQSRTTNQQMPSLARRWKSFFVQFCLFFAFLRVGEAKTPGPEFAIGTFNSCGLLNKGGYLAELKPGVYGATETHLTRGGQQRIHSELQHNVPGARIVHGHEVRSLSNKLGAIGGRSSGVALISHAPIRGLPSQWDDCLWKSSRIQAAAVFANPIWLKIGVCYGYATDPNNQETIQATDKLLEQLTQRIVYDAQGPRAIVGDFNNAKLPFQQILKWKQAGFIDLQSYAYSAWGQEIKPTSRHRTTIDHVWVSKELLPFLQRVEVEDTLFPDHAMVTGYFDGFQKFNAISVWPKPVPLPWESLSEELEDAAVRSSPLKATNSQEVYESIMHRLEDSVDSALRQQGSHGLLPQQRGRATRLAPVTCHHPVVPLRRSRKHEVQVEFMGENFNHVQWCRQVRRLQSLHQSFRRPTTPAKQHEREMQWQAIKSAKGFQGGFAAAWMRRSVVLPGNPVVIPRKLPHGDLVANIFHTMVAQFQLLEKELTRARWNSAKQRRKDDPNVIFQDVARQKSMPVQTLIRSKIAEVTAINDDHLKITYSPQVFNVDEPVWGSNGMLSVASHTPGMITLLSKQEIDVEDILWQEEWTGDTHQIGEEFLTLWTKMWNKHDDLPIHHWDQPIMDMLKQSEPVEATMPLPPITSASWTATARSKKPTTATGPDGVSRLDIIRMPGCLKQELVDLFNDIEADQCAWPPSLMMGSITAIEKRSCSKAPQDYRPITVLTYAYRTWASQRARECLRWLHRFCPDHLVGNRPTMATQDVWWQISLQIEDAVYGNTDLAGITTDIQKAFNHLPRPLVQALALHYGLPPQFVATWHAALHQLQRFFVIGGEATRAVSGETGYPEGDPLSVVAMLLINLGMHTWVTQRVPSAKVYSFVDNWEATSDSAADIPKVLEAFRSFVQLTDLALDEAKTYVWALTPQSRKFLKQQGLSLSLPEKDLGGHMNYSRRNTIYSIKKRIQDHGEMWHWLARSQAPEEQKLKVLATVAWPRCLHSIAGTFIGQEHFAKLRSAAMSALGWSKKGANPLVQLGLRDKPRADPCYWALKETILSMRKQGKKPGVFDVIDRVVAISPLKYQQGPASAFLQRLHMIGWSWNMQGLILDHEQFEWHIQHIPIKALLDRLEHAWFRYVASQVCDRDAFAGICEVDVQATFQRFSKHPVDHQGLLRVALNGTFYTRDKLIHTGRITSVECQWCGMPDSIQHRTWECQGFQTCREVSQETVPDELDQVPCFKLKGWCIEPASYKQLRRALCSQPDRSQQFDLYQPTSQEVQHLLTDGSTDRPTHPQTRLSTWAVVCVLTLFRTSFCPVP